MFIIVSIVCLINVCSSVLTICSTSFTVFHAVHAETSLSTHIRAKPEKPEKNLKKILTNRYIKKENCVFVLRVFSHGKKKNVNTKKTTAEERWTSSRRTSCRLTLWVKTANNLSCHTNSALFLLTQWSTNFSIMFKIS